MKPVILIGGGGHAAVVADALAASGTGILGVIDRELPAGSSSQLGIDVLGDDEYLATLTAGSKPLAIGLGFMPGDFRRRDLYEQLSYRGWDFPVIRHPTVYASENARIADGVQLMAGTVVQSRAVIGSNTIVNTGAIVEHDVTVGAHVHVAPGATICGSVRIGDSAFIGAGATIVQGINIAAGAVVGAGATVLDDVPTDAWVVGTPARVLPVQNG